MNSKFNNSKEIEQIYYNLLVKKGQALLVKFLTGAGELAGELGSAIGRIGRTGIADDVIEGGSILSKDAKAGLKTISALSESRGTDLLTKLGNAAGKAEAEADLLRFAKGSGYTSGTAAEFAEKFADDIVDLSKEIRLLGDNPTEAQLAELYTEHKRAIDTLRKMNEGELDRVLSKYGTPTPKGESEQPKSKDSEKDTSGNGKGKRDDKSDSTTGFWGNATSAVGTFGAIGGIITTLGTGALFLYGSKKLYDVFTWAKDTPIAQQIISVLSGSEPESATEELREIRDAAECIKDMDLKANSDGFKKLSKISQGLNDYADMETGDLSNKEDFIEKIEIGHAAAKILVADDSVDGSILNFLKYIDENPSDFTGSNWERILATVGGGVVGAAGGGLIGAAVGAGVGLGTAYGSEKLGWSFLETYHNDQLKCLQSALTAMKKAEDKMAKAASRLSPNKSEEEPTFEPGSYKPSDYTKFLAPSAGTAAGLGGAALTGVGLSLPPDVQQRISSPIHALVGRVIVAMQTYHVGTPGFDLINEKRKARELIEKSYGTPELAADVVIRLNDNVRLGANYVLSSGDPGIVDKEFLKKYKSFAQSIVSTLPNAIKYFDSMFAYKKGSFKKENNMNKNLKSINNDELLRKAAKDKVSYFDDAKLGLKDQLTKSYYAGLTGMYNEDLPKRSSDYKELYDLHEETGSDLVLESHPKSVTLADSMGKGGLVENGLEQKEKSTQVALTTPTGNFQSKYAQTITYLEKLSKAADNQGKKEVSRLINQTIKNLK